MAPRPLDREGGCHDYGEQKSVVVSRPMQATLACLYSAPIDDVPHIHAVLVYFSRTYHQPQW